GRESPLNEPLIFLDSILCEGLEVTRNDENRNIYDKATPTHIIRKGFLVSKSGAHHQTQSSTCYQQSKIGARRSSPFCCPGRRCYYRIPAHLPGQDLLKK